LALFWHKQIDLLVAKRIRIFIPTLLIVVSCARGGGCRDCADDAFVGQVIENSEEATIERSFILPIEQHDLFTPMHPRRDRHGHYILVNGADWSVFLLASDGSLVDKAGGSGKGPGEFTAINHVELSDDNQLYILDMTQDRITHFNVRQDGLELVGILPVDGRSTEGRYRSIHSIQNTFWGLLATPKFNRTFKLLELDSLMNPVREHLEIPSHFPDIHFSQSALTNGAWSSDSRMFQHVFFDSLVVYTYDVGTRLSDRHVLSQPHRKRIATPLNQEFISSKFGPSETTGIELPQTRNVRHSNNRLLADILYYGGDHTFLLWHDLASKETRYIKAPPDFHIQNFVGNEIIGLKVIPNQANELVILQLADWN
jgi:hypothetical protein